MMSSDSLGAERSLAAASAVFDFASMLTTDGSTSFATSAKESESRDAVETDNWDRVAGSVGCAQTETPRNIKTAAATEGFDFLKTRSWMLIFILLE